MSIYKLKLVFFKYKLNIIIKKKDFFKIHFDIL